MKLLEPLIALGMWAVLGIAADSTGYVEVMPQTEALIEQTEEKWETEETESGNWWMTSEYESPEGTETESESGTEQEAIIVSNVRLIEEERYYDGATDVGVEAEVTNLPEGVQLSLYGTAEKADAGSWPVTVQATLEGAESERYRVEIEQQPLWITIKPRPLQIRISNARKSYYSDNEIANLIFEEEDPIEISGFLPCDQGKNGVPEGFVWPQLCIDEKILQKDSPMYDKGREIVYQDAVTLKRNSDGGIIGNPTKNYTFNIEETEFFDGGDVILSAAPVLGTLDYTVQCPDAEAFKIDTYGNLWIRNGESLIITPTPNSGFTEGKVISGIYGDGTEEFTLIRRNQAGEMIAESQIRSISWYADREAPKGIWMLDGNQMKQAQTSYINCDTQIAYAYVQDIGSGVRSVKLYAAYEEESAINGETLYAEKKSAWTDTTRLLLNRQGVCRIWARTEDQVGNVQYECSEEVVIDHTAPEIWFENIQAGSANSEAVEPVCVVKDEYLQTDSLKVTLSGYQSKIRAVKWNQSESPDQKELRMRMEDLPVSQEWDDIYTLKAEAKDLAGNCSSREIVFSVNRFGSVYYLGKETRQIADQFYLSSPTDVQVYEVNVDYLTESGILLGHEGETRQLQKDRDYTVKKTGNDATWKEYCYTISSGCFEEEGLYYLICASEDRAKNTSDNRMRKQRLEFAVDKSAPDILLAGMEQNGIYRESERTISLECRDNLALKEVTVWINGEEVCRNEKEEQEITLRDRDGWQSIRVTAADKAGNIKDTGEIEFWLSKAEVKPQTKAQNRNQNGTFQEQQGGEKERIQKETERTGKEKPQEKGREKNWKVLAGIAVIAVIWAIFLKTKKEK